MAQNDAFAGGCEEHIMFAHNIAAANRGKADITAFAGACYAIAATVARIAQRDTASCSGRLSKHEGGPRRGVYFVVVMRFDYFDVKVLI